MRSIDLSYRNLISKLSDLCVMIAVVVTATAIVAVQVAMAVEGDTNRKG